MPSCKERNWIRRLDEPRCNATWPVCKDKPCSHCALDPGSMHHVSQVLHEWLASEPLSCRRIQAWSALYLKPNALGSRHVSMLCRRIVYSIECEKEEKDIADFLELPLSSWESVRRMRQWKERETPMQKACQAYMCRDALMSLLVSGDISLIQAQPCRAVLMHFAAVWPCHSAQALQNVFYRLQTSEQALSCSESLESTRSAPLRLRRLSIAKN